MAMLMGIGSIGSTATTSSSKIDSAKGRRRAREVVCAVSGSLKDQYRTLKVQPGSSEKEVKKAFRKLALQYHPDVCKGNNCTVQFHRINEAYDMILNSLRLPEEKEQWRWGNGDGGEDDEYDEETLRGMDEPDWDLWEEWMGWEGAGIRDYSSHINPYI